MSREFKTFLISYFVCLAILGVAIVVAAICLDSMCEGQGFESYGSQDNVEPGYLNCTNPVYVDHILVHEEWQVVKKK